MAEIKVLDKQTCELTLTHEEKGALQKYLGASSTSDRIACDLTVEQAALVGRIFWTMDNCKI